MAAFLFGFFLHSQNWILATVAGIVFLIVSILQAFFIKGMALSNWIVLGESILLMVPLVQHLSFLFILCWFLTFFFLWLANSIGKKELAGLLKISFFKVEQRVTSYALVAVSVFIAMAYLMSLGSGRSFISKDAYRTVLGTTEPVLQRFFQPDFSFSMTIEKLVEDRAVASVAGTSLEQEIKSPAVRQQLVNQTLAVFQSRAESVGFTFKPKDTILDATYAFLNQKFKDLSAQNQFLFSAAVVLLIFFTVRSTALIFRFVIALPAYLLFELLLAIGFAEMALESRAREIILLK